MRIVGIVESIFHPGAGSFFDISYFGITDHNAQSVRIIRIIRFRDNSGIRCIKSIFIYSVPGLVLLFEFFSSNIEFFIRCSKILMPHFTASQLDQILGTLDKVSADFTISERETSLMVVDDEITKLVNIYLSSKKLEGLSDGTIEMYANRLRIFFGMVRT